ncbi:NEAT domain-containing protein [Carnobacterium maltaromaticum]|uniref:NEAT domain-containing protein n=1 Tax=Carnobacterium maltaromaticum TaxID=2751 RepID=UPI001071B186|nr:NEAT domain-containing protein [Carnobacterium maltaromaticum]TFJ72242.1 sortase B cell surface sorting signal domain-containing protein [Carnobacterium maltaromaticum]TFJ77155.1 sortase B cell surface sorting signal domain-containing protein [Carnobacterium maltaromaticum]
MKKMFKKLNSCLVITLLFFSLVPSYTAIAEEPLLKDGGEYQVQLNFYKDQTGGSTKESSAANAYLDHTGTIKVENNQPYLYVTVKNSGWWKNFATSKSGERPATPVPAENYQGTYQDVEVISENPADNTRKVRIKMESLDKIIFSYMHINVDTVPGFNYDNWYQVDLTIDPSSLVVVSEPVIEEPSIPVVPTELADGTYKVPFTAKHATEEKASSMQKYFDNPVWLKVENGKKTIAMNLNDSKTVTSFQTEVGGSLVETGIVSKDEAQNSRIVTFDVPNLTTDLNAHVAYQVDMGGGKLYNGQANFRLLFDPTQAVAIPSNEFPSAPEPEKPTEPTELADGTYKVPFTAKHATEEKASSMQKYFDNPVWLKVENGKKTIAMNLNDSKTVTSFQTEVGGSLVETGIVSKDEAQNSRIVTFDVPNLTTDLNAHVAYQVDMGGGKLYNGQANFRLLFDSTQAVGIQSSEFPSAPEPEKPVTPVDPEKPTDPEKPINPVKPADPTNLENNHQYSVNFSVMKADESEKSMMDQYTLKPGIIKVEKGQPYLYLTLKSSHWIKTFKTEQNGLWSDAAVVSNDNEKDYRVVKYPIANGFAKTKAQTRVTITDMPGLNYDEEYTVSINLDATSLKDITGQTPPVQLPTSPTTNGKVEPANEGTPEKLAKPNFLSANVASAQESKPVTKTKNVQTSDSASIAIYSFIFILASGYFMRRYQLKK